MKTQNLQAEKVSKLQLSKKTVMKLSSPELSLKGKDILKGENFVLTLDCGGDSFYRKCTSQSM